MASQKNQLVLLFLIWGSLACLCYAIPSEYSILSHDLVEYPSEERVVQLFHQWKVEHKKTYRNPEEATLRMEIFKKNLKYIVEKNAMRKSPNEHRLGLNKFADMTNEEFKQRVISKVKIPPIKLRNSVKKDASCEDVPSSLDWRKKGIVTAVKDQGDCGSCWAFSTTGAIEGINALVTGDLISLSEQELVDCDNTNEGCDGGYMDYAFEWVIYNSGIDTESDYPYTGVDGVCNTTKEETKVVSIDSYSDVEQSDSALLCATTGQPISAGMDGSAIDFQLYTGGIYAGSCSSDPNDIDHAVLIVGFGSDEGEDYWIVKNSWGTSWGLDGYFLLKRNTDLEYGECAINYMCSYPIKESSAPSPASPPPPPSPPSPILPPPPPPIVPPPPPPPSPSDCGSYSYCLSDETCCCLYNLFDICIIYGCCEYENAVCCTGTDYCCPSDYPICDIPDGLCLRNSGDLFGVAAKKKTLAKHKLPWTKFEDKKANRPLQIRRNPLPVMG